MSPETYVHELSMQSFKNVFNPYTDTCPLHDIEGAPEIRKQSVATILRKASEAQIDAIWIGRDLGYRGGRRTGLALTDDVHVEAHAQRWNTVIKRSTAGQSVKERTAAVIWQMLNRIDSDVFLWNVFPFHPHAPDKPFSNRSHNAAERQVGEQLLRELVVLLRPHRIIAIGNDAARSAQRVADEFEIFCVRHPSYGGQTEFITQISSLYSLSSARIQKALFD